MTLLDKLDIFSPARCRLFAAKLSTREIAKRSSLPRSTVHEVSKLSSWAGVTVDVMLKFSLGCGVHLLACKRQKQQMKRRSLKFLRKMSQPRLRMVDRLLTSSRPGPIRSE